jgi:NAD(P)H-nitrite reductase large subunit
MHTSITIAELDAIIAQAERAIVPAPDHSVMRLPAATIRKMAEMAKQLLAGEPSTYEARMDAYGKKIDELREANAELTQRLSERTHERNYAQRECEACAETAKTANKERL